MTTISLKLSEELAQRLDDEARARRISRSAIVRECLEQKLFRPRGGNAPSCLDLLADLVGSQPGAGDSSTNPRHLKDFGRARRTHR